MEEEKEKKAAQGIGTLIIFIAMILVAAVAAGVLIQTAASLQSKSLDVGRQTQEKISTDIDIIQVSVNGTTDGEINGGVDTMFIIVKLGAGSSPIKLSDTLIKMDSSVGTGSGNYKFDNSTTGSPTIGVYTSTYLLNSSKSIHGYIVAGDTIELRILSQTGADIKESQDLTLRIIPRNGAIKPVAMTMPSATISPITTLYP